MKIWHYSSTCFLDQILVAGSLQPGNNAGLYRVPLLWFSLDQDWEPMAAVFFGRKKDNCGAVRFGLSQNDSRLLAWRQACTLAGRSRQDRRHAETLAKRHGSNCEDWFATTHVIPIADLEFQIYRSERWCFGDEIQQCPH